MRLFRIVSDASSFISDTTSFIETLADTRALSFGASLTTANTGVSPSAWTKEAVHNGIGLNRINRREKRNVTAYLHGLFKSSP